jgi:hypothetical protein
VVSRANMIPIVVCEDGILLLYNAQILGRDNISGILSDIDSSRNVLSGLDSNVISIRADSVHVLYSHWREIFSWPTGKLIEWG